MAADSVRPPEIDLFCFVHLFLFFSSMFLSKFHLFRLFQATTPFHSLAFSFINRLILPFIAFFLRSASIFYSSEVVSSDEVVSGFLRVTSNHTEVDGPQGREVAAL